MLGFCMPNRCTQIGEEPVFGGPSIRRRSWQQLERPRKTWTNAEGAEITTIGRQYSVDVPPLSHRRNGPIDQSQVERSELRVELEGSNDVGRERQLVFVAGGRIKDLGDRLSHGGSVVSQKVVHLGENEPGHDDQTRGDQDLLVLGEAWSTASRAGESPEEPAGIGNQRRTHVSRSRKSSDSSPSLVSVDSKRRVEGGRRPV